MPKVTARTPNANNWFDPNRKDPGHDLNAPRATHRAKKDRKRWCKGKVGREHVYEYRAFPNHSWAGFSISGDVCKNCGRQEWRGRVAG